MKDFKSWGVKIRDLEDYNYHAIWHNLKTIRLGDSKDDIIELPPDLSEFYDIGITTKCNAECPFCYVSASNKGENFENICELWKSWIGKYPEKKEHNVTYTLKPFQIAIGSTGEPTIHPHFCKFLETVYETNVVPNYTTNGIIISDWRNPWCEEILEATYNFVGGVAVSFGNRSLREKAIFAVRNLLNYGGCKVMIHHLIYDKESVDDFILIAKNYGKDIHYHVLLPLMAHGRSEFKIEDGVFEYLEEQIYRNGISNIAFGANFYSQLEGSKIPVDIYPQEAYSKNVILNKKIIITPSSFNLTPIKEINVL